MYYLNLYQLSILLGLVNPLGNNLVEELLLLLVQLLHVETDGLLSLSLRGVVGHRNLAGVSILGCCAGNQDTGLLGIVDRGSQQSDNFLWCMERCTVRGNRVVPTPLALAQQGLDRLQLSLSSTLVDDELSLEVGAGQFLLCTVANLRTLVLTLIDILAQGLGILTVTGLTGAVYFGQRRHNLVVTILHPTLLLVRHVAVGTAYATLSVDALLRHLVARMLSLQDRRLGNGMDIVIEAYRVVILLGSLQRQTLVVGEHQIVGLAGIVGIVVNKFPSFITIIIHSTCML